MQKILALLLLIGLMNGQGDVMEEKTFGSRLEKGNNEAVANNALEQYYGCQAEDKTECFETSMKAFGQSTDSVTKVLAGLAKGIIKCKAESEDISKCILDLAEKVEDKEAKEQLNLIANILEAQAKMLEEDKKIVAEMNEFKKENFNCTTVEGEEDCKPNEKFAAIIKEENEKIEKELALIEEENKKFIAKNFTCDEEGENCQPKEEFVAEQKAEFLKYNNVKEIEVDINGEKKTVEYVTPTKLALEEDLVALRAALEKEEDKDMINFLNKSIEATQKQIDNPPKELTAEEINALLNGKQE